MSFLSSLPDKTGRRLANVIVRTIHLVGIAGLFGNAMMGTSESIYITLAIVSGIILTLLEAYPGTIWFVQIRGICLYLKLLLLLMLHFYPDAAVSCLIVVIAISGVISHAPSWIRYFSVQHWQVVHSREDLLD